MSDALILDLAHIILGELVSFSEDKRSQKEYLKKHAALWEEVIEKYKEHQNTIQIIRKKIITASDYIELSSRFPNDTRMFTRGIFRTSFHPKDILTEELLTYICIANTIEKDSMYFIQEMRNLLETLGMTDGLIDDGLRELTIKSLIKKLLLLYAH